jgi:hypothetical protein
VDVKSLATACCGGWSDNMNKDPEDEEFFVRHPAYYWLLMVAVYILIGWLYLAGRGGGK